MAAVQFDTFNQYPAIIDCQGNTVDGSNNGVSLVIYGTKISLSKDSIVANNNFQGSFQNMTGQDIITDGETPIPPEPPVAKDKTVNYFQQVNSNPKKLKFFYTDSTTEIVDNVKKVVYQSDANKYTVTFADGTTKVMGKAVAGDVREQTIEEFKDRLGKFIDFLMA
jgi:hypothetical protein